jgi:hypothetical protein
VRFLRVLGIETVICPPRRPDLKPVVGRGIFTFKYEALARQPPQTLADAEELTVKFPHHYNHECPHQGCACQNRTPDEAFPNLPSLPQLPQSVQPDSWLSAYHEHVYRRHVSAAGSIQIDHHLYFIGTADAKQELLIHLDVEQGMFFVSDGKAVLKKLIIQGLYKAGMDFSTYLIAMKAEARTIEYHWKLSWQRTAELT